MEPANGSVVGAQGQLAEWRDPPGMGRILVISSAVGVGLSLVLITAGMMIVGQAWQSSLALGVFIAFWGGLGFGSMIGGVIYLTKLEDAVKVLAADPVAVSPTIRSVDDVATVTGAGPEASIHAADAA